jgi:arthrofactin-type cyclic lipopeptide synthetase C
MSISRPQLVRLPRALESPIADHHLIRWRSIRSGELGIEFTNCTHSLFLFEAPLDLAALRESVRGLTRRHPILLARVCDDPPGPRFRFDAEDAIELETVDLSGRTQSGLEAGVALAAQRIWQPFDYDRGPWFRVFAITLSPLRHVIGFVAHHFICDGVSIGILQSELVVGYFRLQAGDQQAIPAPPFAYTDYAVALNKWIRDGHCAPSAAYWRQLLPGAPATQVPLDYHPGPDDAGLIATRSSHLDPAIVDRLRDLRRSCGFSMNALVVAAMMATVAGLSGSEDVVVVCRTNGRNDLEIVGAVGPFVDAIALRLRVDPQDPFMKLAQRVQRTLIESYAHQRYPYQLVKSALPEIEASDNAPWLNFMDASALRGTQPGSSPLRLIELPPRPPVSHTVRRYGGFYTSVVLDAAGMHVSAEYLSLAFKEETAARYVGMICRRLESAAAETGGLRNAGARLE